MKMSKKDLSMLIGLAGILILAAVWYFVVSPLQTDTQTIETENIGLKSKVDLYQSVNANLAEYQQGIEKMNVEIQEIMNHYPSYISRQDEIMFLSIMEDEYPEDLAIESIGMGGASEVSVATEAVMDAGESTLAVHMFKQPSSYDFRCTYDGMKEMVTYLGTQTNKKSIDEITLSFDSSTGSLKGSLGLSQYYMTGTDKEYQSIKVPSVRKGLDNVFHTVSGAGINADGEAAVEEGAEAEGEEGAQAQNE